MITAKLTQLKEKILQNQQYFAQGFVNVMQHPENGIISNKETIVFPADNLGDYFYFRVPKDIDLRLSPQDTITQCASGYITGAEIYLVACVSDADPEQLVVNLINLLRDKCGGELVLRSFSTNPEAILMRELSGIEKENIEAALQRLDPSHTIVSITFSITSVIPYIKPDCLPDPCKQC